MYGFSRREEPRWSPPDRPDPTSESKVGSTLDLTRIAPYLATPGATVHGHYGEILYEGAGE
ncbi:RNA polymerase Rpb1, domain 5 [Castilleja foliolosa]|uniref:RNA polymerase Rpb1, domain 5 n=1 Tax=Castilleja foliolosa TaxID=1961234 RepID=A0ABD3E1T7_9LAMI